jgi:hypothetical protein
MPGDPKEAAVMRFSWKNMPAGDQPAIGGLGRGVAVQMKRLGVVAEREVEDLGLAQGHAPADEALADLEVVEIVIGHRSRPLRHTSRIVYADRTGSATARVLKVL